MAWSSGWCLVWKSAICRIHNWLGVGQSGVKDTTFLFIAMYVHMAALEDGLKLCKKLARTFRADR
jgi:hypothetical protein